jgi:TRAP-type mannitol/chloroaromatic compound transport system substrate-binding protein
MKNKILLIGLSIMLVLALVLSACAEPTDEEVPDDGQPPTTEKFVWKVQTWDSRAGTYFNNVLTPLAENIAEMSDGRLTLELYGSGDLCTAEELLTATGKGVVDFMNDAYHDSIEPALNYLYCLPMGLRSPEEVMSLWYEHGLLEYLQNEVYLKHNCWMVGPCTEAPVLLITQQPLNTLDDFEGAMLRAYGGIGKLLEKLGATTTFVAYDEIYMALMTGVIDGGHFGSEQNVYELSVYETATCIMRPYIVPVAATVYMVNLDSWNALPDDLKRIVEVAVRDNSAFSWRVSAELNQRNMMEMSTEYGVEYVWLSPEEQERLITEALELWDEMAEASPECAHINGMIKDYMRAMGHIE